MNPDKNSITKICPTCGTKLNENATRCLVCGRTFNLPASGKTKTKNSRQRLPDLTISLPLAIGLLFILMAVGGGLIFMLLRGSGQMAAPEATATASPSPTFQQSPTPTTTFTPEPTFTPLPPREYVVKENDTCGYIAVLYGLNDTRGIEDLNNLPPGCGVLTVGQTLLVPQPTPTATPAATNTPSISQASEDGCDILEYRVGENDTLSGIALNYNIAVETLKNYNGLVSDNIISGQIVKIPLCDRLPTPGPTPTATNPAPYPPTNLLLPADGAIFSGANDTITLQWAAIGGMREGESYAITIEDLTEGQGKKLVDYSTDTKYTIPTSFRPIENAPHIIRWWIQPVRQSGTTPDGDVIWVPAGVQSSPRVFSWSGIGAAATPEP